MHNMCVYLLCLQPRATNAFVQIHVRLSLLQDVQLAQQWLLSLSAAGYSFPPVAEKAVVSPMREAKPRCPKHTSVLITGVNGSIARSEVLHGNLDTC